MILSRRLRIGLSAVAVVAIVAGYLLASRSGAATPEGLAGAVSALGPFAIPAYLAAFVLGELLYLPGMVFVGAGRLVFGPGWGLLVAYLGSLLAITVPFVLARSLRTSTARAFEPRWKLLRGLLDRVESQPLRSLFLLRLFLFLSPPLNYALAFTGIRGRDYVLGSALGIVLPIAVVSLGVGCLS
jgi:uncharacterized membrane protein YdjX (TVP38/TMEM64 family)